MSLVLRIVAGAQEMVLGNGDRAAGYSFKEGTTAYPGVWHDGRRQYDVEIHLGDSLVLRVPPQSPEVDASYDLLEAEA
jgi:hypothetical protein